jgi:steroid 5-alpha reductase family enzyme
MGGSNFVWLAIITLAMGGSTHPRQIVTSIFIMLWAARLSGFLLFRILKTGKDDRFDDKRDKFLPFLGFWVFQMLWVWTVSLPVTILNSPNVLRIPQPSFGKATDIIGIIIFALAFGLEAISDAQKYRFKQGPGKKPGAVCDVGFFKLSRHPNYFAEIMTQVCMYTYCIVFVRIPLLTQNSSHLHHRSHPGELRRSVVEQRCLRSIVRQLRRLHSLDKSPSLPVRFAIAGASRCEEAL